MEDHQRGRSSRAWVAVTGFALLCAGTVLAASWIGFATASKEGAEESAAPEPVAACSNEAIESALQDTARADRALREDNFGDAQMYVQRARLRLEATVAEMKNSGD